VWHVTTASSCAAVTLVPVRVPPHRPLPRRLAVALGPKRKLENHKQMQTQLQILHKYVLFVRSTRVAPQSQHLQLPFASVLKISIVGSWKGTHVLKASIHAQLHWFRHLLPKSCAASAIHTMMERNKQRQLLTFASSRRAAEAVLRFTMSARSGQWVAPALVICMYVRVTTPLFNIPLLLLRRLLPLLRRRLEHCAFVAAHSVTALGHTCMHRNCA